MFHRKLRIEYAAPGAHPKPCPIHWLDNFSMRNFTNDAVFDDTLPIDHGLLEIGNRVPVDKLHTAMDDWFRRKSYLKPAESLLIALL
jgi:hypothetical protein